MTPTSVFSTRLLSSPAFTECGTSTSCRFWLSMRLLTNGGRKNQVSSKIAVNFIRFLIFMNLCRQCKQQWSRASGIQPPADRAIRCSKFGNIYAEAVCGLNFDITLHVHSNYLVNCPPFLCHLWSELSHSTLWVSFRFTTYSERSFWCIYLVAIDVCNTLPFLLYSWLMNKTDCYKLYTTFIPQNARGKKGTR